MNIILIHANEQVRDAVTFAIEGRFNIHVTTAADAAEALIEFSKIQANSKALDILSMADSNSKARKILEETSDVSFLVVQENLVTNELRELFQSELKEVPVIAVMDSAPESASLFIERGFSDFALESSIADDLLNFLSEELDEEHKDIDTGDYCPIETKVLLTLGPLKGDVFIRLSQSKFIRLFSAGDTFDNKDFEKWHTAKKVTRLYIERAAFEEVLQKLSQRIDGMITDETVTQEDARDYASGTLDTIHEVVSRSGFTPEIADIARKNVELTRKAIGKNPRLDAIIKRFEDEPEKYIANHSMLLAEVACAIAQNVDWVSDTTFSKLTIAALFHDITLRNQEIARMQSLQEIAISGKKFSTADIEAFKNHPAAAAELVKEFREIPQDVDAVIMHHHERPDGTGFPRKLTNQYIPQLSALFIVSHDYVDHILTMGEDFSKATCFNKLKSKYLSGNFRAIIKTLDPKFAPGDAEK